MTKIFVATKIYEYNISSPCLFNDEFENHPGGFAVFSYNMAYVRWAFN